MSWDILVVNSSEPVSLEELSVPDFDSTQFVVDCVKATFLDADLSDPSWIRIDNDICSMEIALSEEDVIGNHFMMFVRGGQDPVREIIRLCKEHNWIAYDINGERFLDEKQIEANSFNDWKDYRDHVVNLKKPWWRFW